MENSNTFTLDLNMIDNVSEFVEKYKLFILINFIFFIFLIFFFIFVIVFFLVKMLDISLDKMVFFYDYNKLCNKILKKYGKCEINKIYLVRTGFAKLYTFITNVVTLFKYDDVVKQTGNNYHYHTMLLVEIKLENDRIKWISLEKNNCISMNDNFILTQGMEVKEVELKKEKKMCLEDFLEETRNRMGNKKFFNWHVFENNCQEFTKQLLLTAECYNDCHINFIFNDELMKLSQPSEFFYCIFNCLCIVYNLLEKYIFEIDLFD